MSLNAQWVARKQVIRIAMLFLKRVCKTSSRAKTTLANLTTVAHQRKKGMRKIQYKTRMKYSIYQIALDKNSRRQNPLVAASIRRMLLTPCRTKVYRSRTLKRKPPRP